MFYVSLRINGDYWNKLNADFFLNNQPDALFIQIYSLIKFYMLRAPSLPIIRSLLLYTRVNKNPSA